MANGVSEMRVDWGSVRTRDGVKPDAAVLDVFVTSEDIDTVYDAYCDIEYAAFYNRDLEEAALPLTSALIEMVCSGRCTHWGLHWVTDALYEISLSQTMREEETDGTGLADRCRSIIRDNLPRGLLGVSRTALKAVFQAACLVARCSSSTSLGVLYPRAEWSRF